MHVHKLPDDITETEVERACSRCSSGPDADALLLFSQGAQVALQAALETSAVGSREVASSPVLKVVVENPPYPISLDTLWEVRRGAADRR